jgi:DNA-binding beta-propeller fold protein YncE
VSLIDTQDMTVVGNIKVQGGPDCMDITPDGKELWVTQRFLRRIAVVDIEQMRVVASVPVGKSPHGVMMLKSGPAGPGTAPVRAASTAADQK